MSKTVVDDRLAHIAFIMDGNGRWAQKRGLAREFGHKEGSEAFKRVVGYCADIGIKVITVYAFSTENWKRPKNEIAAIMKLLNTYLSNCEDELAKRGVRFRMIGDKSKLPSYIVKKINKVEASTQNNPLILNFALNYGGRAEIVAAVNKLLDSGKKNISEQDISDAIYTYDCADPDLIVRTGGDLRISNFLIWQAAYSELYFTETLWPDMSESDIDNDVEDFYSRQRRYGGIVKP